MALAHVGFKGYRQTALYAVIPEVGAAAAPVLWLLHDRGGRGDDFLRHTQLELFCAGKPVYVICPSIANHDYRNHPGESHANWEDYITRYVWDVAHQMFPRASVRPEDNVAAGVGLGAAAAARFAREHPGRYARAVSLSAPGVPVDWTAVNERLRALMGTIPPA